jgi:hypothetical protein
MAGYQDRSGGTFRLKGLQNVPTIIHLQQLVEEFIVEIEGPPKNCDVSRWGQFTDVKGIKKEMFGRLEAQFENWLNS